jgi:hypothetical protein
MTVYIIQVGKNIIGVYRTKEAAKAQRLELIKELGNSIAVKYIEWTTTD